MISAVVISPVALQLSCVAALLLTALLAIALSRSERATSIIYGVTLAACVVALLGSLRSLLGAPATPLSLTLPVGLPWLGAHFRLDALASFFLIVVNLGGAAASLYGLGYGHHDPSPHRVLPFYAAFLAGMNLVVLADDAFSYLLCWEFMSLASWALVMAHHREPGNAKAGYVSQVDYDTSSYLKTVQNISAVDVIGGRPREVSVTIDPSALAARGLDPMAVERAIAAAMAQRPDRETTG